MIKHSSTISIFRIFLLLISSMPLSLNCLPSYFTFMAPPAIVAQLKNELAHEEQEILEEFCSTHDITMDDFTLILNKLREVQNLGRTETAATLGRGTLTVNINIPKVKSCETEPLSNAQEKKLKDIFRQEGIELSHIVPYKENRGNVLAGVSGTIHDPVLYIYPRFWEQGSIIQRILLLHELTHVKHEDFMKECILVLLHKFSKAEKHVCTTHPDYTSTPSDKRLSITLNESTDISKSPDSAAAESENKTTEIVFKYDGDDSMPLNSRPTTYSKFCEKRADIEAMLASNRMAMYDFLAWRKPSTTPVYGPSPEDLTLEIERYAYLEGVMKKVNKAVRQELGQYFTNAITQPLKGLSWLCAQVDETHDGTE